VVVPQLLELTRTFAEPQMRQMCNVLLRYNLDATEWPAVGAVAQQTAKAGLFEGFVAEQEPSVYHLKACGDFCLCRCRALSSFVCHHAPLLVPLQLGSIV